MSNPVNTRLKEIALLFGTFLIATCGLVYELIEGTLSSYLLGDSVFHFSLVIGLFMSSMGIGAWLSRFIDRELERAFIRLQLTISLIGGFSAFILFYAFAYIQNYDAFLYLITISLGTMIGIEIPLIIRILKESFSLKTNISNVFTVDYIGALFASLLFPLVLIPQLGLMQTSFLFGMINLFVGAMAYYIFRQLLGIRYVFYIVSIFVVLLLGFWQSNKLTTFIENKLYQKNIIYTEQTPYQKIIVTGRDNRVQFYINGAIQFDSIDEHRYHESLVHPAMIATPHHENILIIGGGDGMALREVLKYNDVQKITLVDLDPAITNLFTTHPLLSKLNDNAYKSENVTVVNQDAWKFIEGSEELYDVIVIDLPDPNSISLSRLYSETFYHLLQKQLAQTGIIVTQATSPMFTHEAFWSIEETMLSSGLKTMPYHTYVPSFGEWGFVMGAKLAMRLNYANLPKQLRYLNEEIISNSTIFAPDIAKPAIESNTLSQHKLIQYYNQGWKRWYE